MDQRDQPLTHKYIAYGGGVKLSRDNCAPCCDGDCLAVGVIMFGMDKGASEILEQHLAYCNYPGTAVNHGQFLYPGERLMPQPGVLFVSLVTNTTGEQFIPFVEVCSGAWGLQWCPVCVAKRGSSAGPDACST